MRDPTVFGKLPAHGDFVARGTFAARTQAWDAALSRSMVSARSALGDAFADRWATAPAWRFCLPHGEAWLAGAIALSVDRSGREFPAIAAAGATSPREVGGVAAACEAALFAAIASRLSVDELLVRMAADPAPSSSGMERSGWWLDPAGPMLQGELPDELIARMLDCAEVSA